MTTAKLITEPAAADFLTSPKTRHLLSPFMERARSMAEAAALLELKFPTLHRRVRQMVKLGLLEITHQETQSGHLIKFYGVTSPEFIVPVAATQTTDLETFVTDGFRGSAEVLGRGVAQELAACAPRWGFRIYWDDGVVQQAAALGETGALLEPSPERRSFYGDCGLHLKRDDAQAFGSELQALYEKYLSLGQADEDEPYYFLFVGFTPL